MRDELLSLSQGHGTAWEPLMDVVLARKVNAALGGALVAPWELQDMDEATLQMLIAYVDDLPVMTAGWSKVQAIRSSWRSKHPTYGKHRRGVRH